MSLSNAVDRFSTFLTIAYILVINPQILSGAGLPINEVTTSTALSSALATLMTGLFANLPFAVAPGMGLNAFLVFSEVLGQGVPLPTALASCMTAAGLVAVLALLRALNIILALVPNTIKLATVVGMGLLLSLIGLTSAGVVVANEDTLVGLGELATLKVALAVGGLALIASLHHLKVRGSILIGMACTAIACFAATNTWPTKIFALPSMKTFPLDFSSILALSPSSLSAVTAYMLVMVFDIGGAMFGLGKLAGIVEGNAVPGSVAMFLSAAAGTAFGSITGTTPLIIAAESAVGIKEGGRTGLVAVTVSVCFMISTFLSPLIQALPPVTTAPVLVLVGAMMMGEAGHVDWTCMTSAVPAFLTMVIQPFTFSIANGIYAGLCFSILLFFFTGDFITYFKDLIAPSEAAESSHRGSGTMDEPLLDPVPNKISFGRISHRLQDAITHTQPYDRTPELLIGSSRTDTGRSIGGYSAPRSPPMYPPIPT